MNVLVVEDNLIISMFIEMILVKNGHNVIGKTSNIKDSICILQNQKVDLVFVDLSLDKGESGIELSRIINSDFNLPFLFMTGNSAFLKAPEFEDLNPLAILSKPVDERMLQNFLDKILNKYYKT